MANRHDIILNDEFERLPDLIRKGAKPGDVYGEHVVMLGASYEPVMSLACSLRKSGYSTTRADALEEAYDIYLHRCTKGDFERVGEVAVVGTSIRAMCQSLV